MSTLLQFLTHQRVFFKKTDCSVYRSAECSVSQLTVQRVRVQFVHLYIFCINFLQQIVEHVSKIEFSFTRFQSIRFLFKIKNASA